MIELQAIGQVLESAGDAGAAILVYIVLKWLDWRLVGRPQIDFYNEKETKP